MTKPAFDRRNPFATVPEMNSIVERFMPPPDSVARKRTWGSRTYSYHIPVSLHERSQRLQKAMLSIVQFDEKGNARADATTVDNIAKAMMSWAFSRVDENPKLITPRTNPRGRGHMTIMNWEKSEERPWEKEKLELRDPIKKKKPAEKVRAKSLTFRWPAEIDSRIRAIAGTQDGATAQSPMKHIIPIGEVVIRLLEIALDDYIACEFRLKPEAEASIKVTTWEKVKKPESEFPPKNV